MWMILQFVRNKLKIYICIFDYNGTQPPWYLIYYICVFYSNGNTKYFSLNRNGIFLSMIRGCLHILVLFLKFVILSLCTCATKIAFFLNDNIIFLLEIQIKPLFWRYFDKLTFYCLDNWLTYFVFLILNKK